RECVGKCAFVPWRDEEAGDPVLNDLRQTTDVGCDYCATDRARLGRHEPKGLDVRAYSYDVGCVAQNRPDTADIAEKVSSRFQPELPGEVGQMRAIRSFSGDNDVSIDVRPEHDPQSADYSVETLECDQRAGASDHKRSGRDPERIPKLAGVAGAQALGIDSV